MIQCTDESLSIEPFSLCNAVYRTTGTIVQYYMNKPIIEINATDEEFTGKPAPGYNIFG